MEVLRGGLWVVEKLRSGPRMHAYKASKWGMEHAPLFFFIPVFYCHTRAEFVWDYALCYRMHIIAGWLSVLY